jgi:hypothetical protein
MNTAVQATSIERAYSLDSTTDSYIILVEYFHLYHFKRDEESYLKTQLAWNIWLGCWIWG